MDIPALFSVSALLGRGARFSLDGPDTLASSNHLSALDVDNVVCGATSPPFVSLEGDKFGEASPRPAQTDTSGVVFGMGGASANIELVGGDTVNPVEGVVVVGVVVSEPPISAVSEPREDTGSRVNKA